MSYIIFFIFGVTDHNINSNFGGGNLYIFLYIILTLEEDPIHIFGNSNNIHAKLIHGINAVQH